MIVTLCNEVSAAMNIVLKNIYTYFYIESFLFQKFIFGTIYNDYWKTYEQIDKNIYEHKKIYVINYSENFINLITGTYTQKIMKKQIF